MPDAFTTIHRKAIIALASKAKDLAVQAPVKFNLVMNLKTAKALDKTAKALDRDIPPTLLARADEVIE